MLRSIFCLHSFGVGILCLLGSAAGAQEPNGAREKLAAQGIEFSPARWVQYAAQGDSRMVELFLEAGMPVNVQDAKRQVSALHNAASQGHLELVKKLIDKGANPNLKDWNGYTPLINAAFASQQKVVEYLLAHGAKVDVVPVSGPTALIAAIQRGSAEIVTALLHAGANPQLPSAAGISPAQAAELSAHNELIAQLGGTEVRP